MPTRIRRRTLLKSAGLTAGAAAVSSGVRQAEAEARAKPPGGLDQVEHVVILMQENRSFDHYYGSLRGVRGFDDPTAVRIGGGRSVFDQLNLAKTATLAPFHLDTARSDAQEVPSLPHDWETMHLAWNEGRNDSWPTWKSDYTMGYFSRTDIPYHYGLADAFTICDNYFASLLGPTTPNRLYLWSGTIDPEGRHGGPASTNPLDYTPTFSWTTYPERLERAGISWRVYANDEVGNSDDHPYVGDYGDNSLWLFKQYHDALNSHDPRRQRLAQRAGLHTRWKPDSGKGEQVEHVLDTFLSDCAAGHLPAVSWVVAPYGWCEHPSARPAYGEAFVEAMLNAIWKDPELWSKTVVFINYDENDGFFDHIPPPVPPPGTPGEFLPLISDANSFPITWAGQPLGIPTADLGGQTPIGLGMRVPMTVISPWSTGGFVNSEVFDHTSVLQFLERWTGVREENISPWRRQICGDLLSCFDFTTKKASFPSLPDANALKLHAQGVQTKLPTTIPPLGGLDTPSVKERGTRPARPLPYQLGAHTVHAPRGHEVMVNNLGSAAVAIHVRDQGSPEIGVTHLTIPPEHTSSVFVSPSGQLDVTVHGPNGFLLAASGEPSDALDVSTSVIGTAYPKLVIAISNLGNKPARIRIGGQEIVAGVAARHEHIIDALAHDHGWYDVTVTSPTYPGLRRRFAGHLENGQPSQSQRF
ncbi:phospholipase C, phosphocholine-specific [Gordonia jinhuaensis]|uniref:phospholipase C n=1 Tax=Gordonia jinhuaensis TaxID=1517702 RepID=A0A916T488_9ACTN|nr:phospholipase C, phosphocholine-specific [Gordonia jinhuaensis]GGB28225.1 phospholipase C, phosphocholine-specific [Gordonia jinhuaensis]